VLSGRNVPLEEAGKRGKITMTNLPSPFKSPEGEAEFLAAFGLL
jgi:hypothetical protein